MQLKEFYKKNNIKEGNKIRFEFKEQVIEGILLPSTNQSIIIKLDSGYNAGFDLKNIQNLEIINNSNQNDLVQKKSENSSLKQKKINEKNDLQTIVLIHTGGTISSKIDYSTGGATAIFDENNLSILFNEYENKTNFKQVSALNKMSEEMTLKDYSIIVETIEKEVNNKIKGIIVLHGTDTLCYSSAYTAFAIENPALPIIFVGSQRSIDRGSTDAIMNLSCAIELILQTNFKEVAICMHHTTNDDYCAILSAVKTRKTHTSKRNAFKTINDLPRAIINYKTKDIEFVKKIKPVEEKISIKNKFEPRVGILKIYPGINEKILDYYNKEKYAGLIIEGTGLGHSPIGKNNVFFEGLKKLIDNGCVVGMTSQCINGRVNSTVYSTLRKLNEIGIIFCEDMLTETAYIKLSWLLGNYSKKETKEMLSKNLRNEISLFSRVDVFS